MPGAPAAADAVPTRGLRVLLVDDRPDNLLALEAVLEPLGVEMATASSGEEALRLLLDEEFAVIVLDVQMPGLDGFETARLIKGRERTRHVPIIFLTAISGALEHHLEGYASGAIDYVYKPFEPEILRAKVAALAELVNTKEQLEREVARRRASELHLADRERQLAGAESLAHVGAWSWDIASDSMLWSDELFRIFGLLPQSLIATFERYLDAVHPDDRALVDEAVRGTLSSLQTYQVEHRVVRPDGGVAWVRGQGQVVHNQQGDARMFGAVQDITERRRTEEGLTQFFNLSLHLMAIAGLDGYFRRANHSFTRLLGWSEAELLAHPFLELIHPEDREHWLQELGRLREGGDSTDYELRLLAKDGSWRWVRWSAKPIADEEVVYVVAIDVTERKRAAELLRESEERYRALVEHAPEAIVVLDLDEGRFVEVNREAERLFGMSREELCRVGPSDVSPELQPDGRPSLQAAEEWSKQALEGETAQFEWLHRNAQGEPVLCDIRFLRLPGSGRKLVRGSLIDITQRRRVEEARKELTAREEALRQQRDIARDLQQSLLPERLPELPGLRCSARYLPGSAGLEVGGDWYDVMAVAGGGIAVAIGDVVGRGLRAAVTMGQLRTGLRAYALEDPSPSKVVARLDRLAQSLSEASMATLTYAVYEPESSLLRFICAGHSPLLVVGSDGAATFLEDGRCAPLGVCALAVKEGVVVLEPGSLLVLYTDGLVERPGQTLDEGLELLASVVGDCAGGSPDELCDSIMAAMVGPSQPKDDVALLVLSLAAEHTERFQFAGLTDARQLGAVRHALGNWLNQVGATSTECDDIVLAASEAMTNSLMHAYGAGEGTVEIEASVEDKEVVVTIIDAGAWRSRATSIGGRGFTLMQALVGSVHVDSDASGTRVRLRRRLGHPLDPPKPVEFPWQGDEEPATKRAADRIVLVALADTIDLSNAERTGSALTRCIGAEHLGLVLDLTAITYLDSSGIRMLYELKRHLERRRQRLRVVVPPGSPVQRLLELARAGVIVAVAESVDQAYSAIQED